jgi:hypothetical protein
MRRLTPRCTSTFAPPFHVPSYDIYPHVYENPQPKDHKAYSDNSSAYQAKHIEPARPVHYRSPVSSHPFVGRKRNLHRVKDRSNYSKNKQNGAMEPREVVSILSMQLLEVKLAQQYRGTEVESRQPQLHEAVSHGHVCILNVSDVRDEVTKRRPWGQGANCPAEQH